MYSTREERANWITHGLGLLLSLIGAGFMFFYLARHNYALSAWMCVGVYLASLILLYSASTLYHFVRSVQWKHIFRIADHSAIYAKIAGTYTPFLVLAIPDYLGYELLVTVWLLTAAGILFKVFFVKKLNVLSTLIYLGMGWMAILVIAPLYEILPHYIFWLIITGGVFFTAGVIFYLMKKIHYSHSIWHVFVMGGSSCHFASIYFLLSAG